MSDYDRRITPARPDLAAAHLEGKVEAERFAHGRAMHAAHGIVGLRAAPYDDASLHTELVYGERFTIYEEEKGWAWGQAEADSYVGYVRADALAKDGAEPTHRVTALSTALLPAPTVMRSPRDMLPMNAKVAIVGSEGNFARTMGGEYIFAGHIAPLAARAPDWVTVAERFIGMPYVFGGKTAAGIDCSGLVQTALEAGGIAAPRDADMMERDLGKPIAVSADLAGLKRGDIAFWNDHVGIMLDAKRLIHANSFHMQVAVEPLADAVARIFARGDAMTAIKRL